MEGSSQFTKPESVEGVPLVVHEPKDINDFKSFDIAAVTNMIQPSLSAHVPEQVVAQEPRLEHHSKVMHPESEEQLNFPEGVMGKLEVAPGVSGPRKVLRPWDLIKKRLANAAKATAASLAVMAGLGGALGASNAQAEAIPGLDQAGKVIGANILNGILGGTPLAVGMDRQGNVGVVAKSPAQMAMMRPAARQPGIENLTASMGLNILEQGSLFSISRNANPGENPVTIKKYYNDNHYTTSISLKQAPNGGLLLSTTYVENGLTRSQMAVINIDQTGKMVTTLIGN